VLQERPLSARNCVFVAESGDELAGPPSGIDPNELARRVRARRREHGLSLRGAAIEAGVSAPTLSRVERGYLPERQNLFRLLRWTGLELEPQPRKDDQRHPTMDVHRSDAPTMEAIELHLRADPNLKDEDAKTLAQMFRLAYESLSGRDRTE
jgi:transcriptional regulator with XRE-family HTH domain